MKTSLTWSTSAQRARRYKRQEYEAGTLPIKEWFPEWRRKLKKELAERDGHWCNICFWPFESRLREATIDHVIPVSKGGSHDKENLQLACLDCNQIKGNEIWSQTEVVRRRTQAIASSKPPRAPSPSRSGRGGSKKDLYCLASWQE